MPSGHRKQKTEDLLEEQERIWRQIEKLTPDIQGADQEYQRIHAALGGCKDAEKRSQLKEKLDKASERIIALHRARESLVTSYRSIGDEIDRSEGIRK